MSIKKKKDESSSPIDKVAGVSVDKALTDNQKTTAKKRIERAIVKDTEWDGVELENIARKAAQDRYMALQNSSYMGEVARRIVLGQETRAIAAWLVTVAPHEFPDIKMPSLIVQLENFKKDLLEKVYQYGSDELKEGRIPDINPIDMEIIRFKDKPLIVQGMLERAVLFQEARLIKAMSVEAALAAEGAHVVSDQVSGELDRYMRYVERLGAYKKLIGKEDDGDSAVRELTHNFQQMSKVYDLLPAKSKEEFREQIESLAQTRAIQEKEAKKREDAD